MKRKSINQKKELNLISVLIKDISDNKNPDIIYNAMEEIVPQIAVDKVKVLTKAIISIMPLEALSYYYYKRASLMSIIMVYSNSGEYSIVVESAPPILDNFYNELDEITTILDNAIIRL